MAAPLGSSESPQRGQTQKIPIHLYKLWSLPLMACNVSLWRMGHSHGWNMGTLHLGSDGLEPTSVLACPQRDRAGTLLPRGMLPHLWQEYTSGTQPWIKWRVKGAKRRKKKEPLKSHPLETRVFHLCSSSRTPTSSPWPDVRYVPLLFHVSSPPFWWWTERDKKIRNIS